MPKLPRVPRVSIVIPLQRDPHRFEDTLLSVLVNRPDDCQVIVAHNGTYDDPFDLSDEVEFVTARSSNLVDLVRDAFDSTRGSYVHVVGSGWKATQGWMSDSLDRFESADLAAFAPTCTQPSTGNRASTGWHDSAGRLCHPSIDEREKPAAKKPQGFFLNACVIRRRLLGDLLESMAPAVNDPIAVGYAFGLMLRRSGWTIEVANECELEADAPIHEMESDADRGQCLAAIRQRILPSLPAPGKLDLLRSALMGGSSLGEMMGVLRGTGSLPAMRRAIDPEGVSSADELARVINLPQERPSAARRMAA